MNAGGQSHCCPTGNERPPKPRWFSSTRLRSAARDRGGEYAQAVARALPHASRVADLWHLMKNASRAFFDAVRKSMRQVRTAIGTAIVNPKLLTAVRWLRYARMSAARRGKCRYSRVRQRGGPSRKSCAEAGMAESWSAVSFVASRPTSSGSGKPL